MKTAYIIEVWSPKLRRYTHLYTSSSLEWAEKMYNKPYNRIHTRRMVKVSEEVLYRDRVIKRR